MADCDQMQRQLNDLLDGELDAARSVAVTEHLGGCVDCRRELAALKATHALLQDVPVPDGGRARRRALGGLRRAAAASPAPARTGIRWQGSLVSAALVAVLMLAIFWGPKQMDGLDRPVAPAAARAHK